MSAIIEQLNQEHANMSRILDLLEHEIDAFDRGEVADFHLVQEIMDYCLDYPEACHHSKEDAIYAVMIDRRPNLADEIADLSGAHAKLGRQTQGAHGTVERIMRDETLARDLVLDVFGTFLDSYRLHFELEEENFFLGGRASSQRCRLGPRRSNLGGSAQSSIDRCGRRPFRDVASGHPAHARFFGGSWIAKLHLPKIGLPL